jgi:formate dehydrogenase subunit delta
MDPNAMHSKSDKLVMMANQIARNTAIQGEERAVLATYRQFKLFWEPRMRENLAAHIVAGGGKDLHPIALKAFQSLATAAPPASSPKQDVKPAAAKPVVGKPKKPAKA